MMREELLRLADLCEAASGPDHVLDVAILSTALGFRDVHSDGTLFDCGNDGYWVRPEYADADHPALPSPTASLDAAMTLVVDSEIWGVSKQEHNPGRDYYYQASVMPFGPHPWHEAKAATPALALCAAALRSRAALLHK